MILHCFHRITESSDGLPPTQRFPDLGPIVASRHTTFPLPDTSPPHDFRQDYEHIKPSSASGVVGALLPVPGMFFSSLVRRLPQVVTVSAKAPPPQRPALIATHTQALLSATDPLPGVSSPHCNQYFRRVFRFLSLFLQYNKNTYLVFDPS